MGAWSADILGSDDAMDVLGKIETILGVEALYPLNFETKERQTEIKILLDRYQYRLVSELTDPLEYIILPCVYMACGARIPEAIKNRALAACDSEIQDLKTDNSVGWKNPLIRVSYLEAHQNAMRNFKPGTPVQTPTTGLFATISKGMEMSETMTLSLSPLANATVMEDEKQAVREKVLTATSSDPVTLSPREIYVLVRLYNESQDLIHETYGSQIA